MLIEKLKQLLLFARLKPFKNNSKERYRKIILSGVSGIAARSIGILVSIITVPLTLGYLGTERYGLWMTISSMLAIIQFSDLGLGNALVNLIAEANGRDDKDAASKYISSVFFLSLGIAIILLLLLVAVYDFIPWARLYNLKTTLAIKDAGPASFVLFISAVFTVPAGLIRRIQLGYQDESIANLWVAAGNLLGFIFVLIAIYFKTGLTWLAAGMAFGPIIACLFNWYQYIGWKKRGWLLPRVKLFKLKTVRQVGGIGALFLILQLSSLIGNSSDNIVIAQVLGAAAVAKYAIVYKLFSIGLLSQYFITPLWPAFGEALARKDFDWARKTLKRVLLYNLAITFAIGLFLLFTGKLIITFWVGMNMVPSTFLLAGFAIWTMLFSFIGIMSTFLFYEHTLTKQIWFYALSSCIALILKIILAHYWYISGVVWAIVIGYAVFYVVPSLRLAFHTLKRCES